MEPTMQQSSPQPKTTATSQQLIDALIQAKGDTKAYSKVLANVQLRQQEWDIYSSFKSDCYTRNLVYRDDTFELLLLCWNARQVSPIHNHAGQNCWMYMLDGTVVEERFEAKAQGNQLTSLVKSGELAVAVGKFAFINDDLALHRICNRTDKPARTLHLYSRPIDFCHIYCEQTKQVQAKTLRYDTQYGKPSL